MSSGSSIPINAEMNLFDDYRIPIIRWIHELRPRGIIVGLHAVGEKPRGPDFQRCCVYRNGEPPPASVNQLER